ncbi:site-2 protease family protein [Salinibaculum rarum]|uniref:site-2 protease family protein n=1 Tax=Salinibaculum rarum TaxID=3058903 RepID=UPI0026601197|nr:site-2 protease family protein [Salinibaculum sp. KK48]
MINGWLILGIAAITFIISIYGLEKTNLLPEFLQPYGPVVTVQTERSKHTIDTIANASPRFWRYWGSGGLIAAVGVLLSTMVLLVVSAFTVIRNPPEPTGIYHPTNMLIVPGVNDYLPLSVLPEILISLGIGIIIHEAGHGIFCRVADIDIDRVGLILFTILPVGAFVEPDADQEESAPTMDRLRMYAAGVTNNFAFSILSFALLFVVIGALITPAGGVAIAHSYPDSPADHAGIEEGDRVTHINGTPVNDLPGAQNRLAATNADTVQITVNSEKQITIRRQVYVVGALEGINIAPRAKITAVNETEVTTEQEFEAAIRNASTNTVTLTTASKKNVTVPVGVPVKASPDSPATNTALSSEQTMYVTHLNEKRVITADELQKVLENTTGAVTARLYHDGEVRNTTITANNGEYGLIPARGTIGIQTTDIGVESYPLQTYLGFYKGDFSMNGQLPWYQQFLLLLTLPMATSLGLPFNFPGVTGAEANFYDTIPALAGVEPAVFFLANVLFWSGWINMHIGLFNCIPTFPLDGGHMVKTSIESLLERYNIAAEDSRLSSILTVGFTVVIFIALASLFAVPFLFG